MKTSDHPTLPLSIYFDGSCRLCAAEMNNLRTVDDGEHLRFIDCAAPDFDDTSLRLQGIDRDKLMSAMHVQDAAGAWFTHADAFEVMYRAVGLPGLASAWTHPLLRAANERLYAWVVRHRQQLSRLHAHRVIDAFWVWLARRIAARKAQAAACRIDGPACNNASSTLHERSAS